jgi:tRNA-dihydrouridine synthase 4
MNRRELVAEVVREANKRLERDGWTDTRTVSVKIRVHKDLRQVSHNNAENSVH